MIEIRQKSGNCNILITNYDLYMGELINSFMHGKFTGVVT